MNKKKKSGENSGDEDVNRGEYSFFNCEELGHLEIEFPYLKIGSEEAENTNEIEDNPKIEKENNHEA
jgi:hypothetical protein